MLIICVFKLKMNVDSQHSVSVSPRNLTRNSKAEWSTRNLCGEPSRANLEYAFIWYNMVCTDGLGELVKALY